VIVVDASVIVAFLLRQTGSDALFDFVASQEALAAPTLIDYEIGSALRRNLLAGKLTVDQANSAIVNARLLNFDYYDAAALSQRAWQLRSNVTFYDACYLALSELLFVPLYTRDKRLTNAPHHSADVRLV
jgi:predicted nucleic acid-binding protein